MNIKTMKNASFLPSEKTLEETLNDCSIDAIIAIDTDRNIVAWNLAAEKYYGKSKLAVIGRPVGQAIPSMMEDEESVKAIQFALKGIKSFIPSSKRFSH